MLVCEQGLTGKGIAVVGDPAATVGKFVDSDGEAVAVSVDVGNVCTRADCCNLSGFENEACGIGGRIWRAPDADADPVVAADVAHGKWPGRR